MKSIESQLESFSGYLDLGMFLEANEELEKLPEEIKHLPRVLEARLALLMEMEHWEEGVTMGKSLSKEWPEEHEFYFKTAYCLHELKRTQEAGRCILQVAPLSIRETALYFYNLACYEAQLGNVPEARQLLKVCF